MTGPLLVMGATSGIGAKVVDEATGRGIPVRAFARSAGEMQATDLVIPVAGDAREPSDVARALEGAEAVIYALGIRERLSMIWEEETMFSETTRVLIEAMGAAGVRRLVAITGFGAGRSADAMSFLERTGHRAVLGKPYEDKTRQEALIMESDLDWTVVRPVILTKSGRTGRYRVLREPSRWRNGLISRADVAAYCVDAVTDGLDLKADIVLAR
jgi:putative NADH-flavin reductase